MSVPAAGLNVRRLQEPDFYPHAVRGLRLVETHISWVFLTGDFAYKVKKPLDLGFLDFSTLEKRAHCCREELRLNRRLAPGIYLDAVPITGSLDAPSLAAEGEPIEFAVKMRQFDEEGLLDRLIARGALGADRIDRIARIVAEFHARIDRAPEDSDFGTPERAHYPVAENFHQTLPLVSDPELRSRLERLQAWSEAAYARLAPLMAARRDGGFIRECHGDMHLGNMAEVDGDVAIFDGIEFNPNLRWIDVMSEVAFLCMDLEQRGRPDYAWRFLNAYLERTGDYPGLGMLRYYQAYRAMVRAKVTAIRLAQPGLPEADQAAARASFLGYLGLAEGYAADGHPILLITRGPSGVGKTWLAGGLAERLGAVRVRSDVERKRLADLAPEARSASGIGEGLYTPEMTRATYGRLASLARQVLSAGLPVIVDAAFLDRAQRDPFRAVAAELGVPFRVLALAADAKTLMDRLAERKRVGSDASEATHAVLARQLETLRPLDPDEAASSVPVDAGGTVDLDALAADLRQRLSA
jgi:hypothetical protein